jgi:protocatechuate 3,4-dioxygenase, beta subunit
MAQGAKADGAKRGRANTTADRRSATPVDPPFLYPEYRSTALRAPLRPLLRVPYGPTELSGPAADALLGGERAIKIAYAADLTKQHGGEPLGERIIVHGRILDASGHALPGVLVEVWQANAAGRYAHAIDQHPAPLDPHFTGAGFCVTDAQGRYEFVTIKPGAYPWKNHHNAWRPAHIHFSVVGPAFVQRLVTQMYFPGDPLLEADPIFLAVADRAARQRLVATLDWKKTVPDWALAYDFDLTLGGRHATPAGAAARVKEGT